MMTKRSLRTPLVLAVLLCSHTAWAAVTLSTGTTISVGNATSGATVTSASITASSDTGMPTIKFVKGAAPECAMFTFPATLSLTGNNPSTGAFTVDFTGGGTRGLKSCTFEIQDNANNAVLASNLTVTGTTIGPAAQITSSSTNFGSVRHNDAALSATSSTIDFTISNNGDAGHTLQVDAISFSGTNPGDWSVVAGGPAFPAMIPQGMNATWSIRFNPSAGGARSANLVVASNEPGAAMKTVGLTGTGTNAVIATSNVSFGVVTAGSSATQSSTISNSASASAGTLTLVTASATATISQTSTWFSFGNTLGCNGGTSCTVTASNAPIPPNRALPIVCAPPAGASGMEMATVTVNSDSDSGGDNLATVTCTAGRPDIAVDVTALDFMSQALGTTSAARTINITNNGTQNLTFWFAKSGADAALFTATAPGGCGTNSANLCVVTPSNSLAISVTFTPTTVGAKTALITITNNDPDTGDGTKTVSLSGTGTAAIATVTTPATVPIAFGNIEVGKTSSAATLTVTNTGNVDLTISSASLTAGAPNFEVASGMAGMQVLGPNGTATWTLVCKPTVQGALTGNFRVSSNGHGTSTINVGLSCTGQRGFLTVTPSSHNFGGVRAGDTVSTTFTLENTGNVPVTNITYVLDAKLLGFTVTNAPTSLAAGASQTVTLTFSPATANDGCTVAATGDCGITFTGDWGVTPTKTMAIFVAQGDGLNATYDTYPASPNPLDFGAIRYDATPTMAVEVIDTGGSPLQIVDVRLTHGGSTDASELRITGCTRNGVAVACPNSMAPATNPPVGLSANPNKMFVNIMCDPNNRIGMLEATLTVTSDLAQGQMPVRTVPIRCVSETATLQTNVGMLLDFGATDLDATPVSVTRTITLTNMGKQPLNLTSAATVGGAHVGRFTFAPTSAQVVQPGNSYSVDVSYTPTAEKPPDQPDVAFITFPVAGIVPETPGGTPPTSVTISISGYGADRHISVADAPLFPDTFKNPGDAAPVMPVTITNTGYAPLDVTAVMLDNDPIWTLQNPDPVVIPAASSYDFNVVFRPLMAGKAPTGHLVVMNNDNERMMVSVDLNGNGLSRNVAMGPRVIPLGFTGIGIPVRLSELAPDALLDVVNMDSVNGFTIARIGVDSIAGADGTFEIVDLAGNEPTDIPLEPGATHTFDITFTPNEVGDFEAIATLYLDQDPEGAAQVTLRGRGLYVDARGGGGCQAADTGARGWLALVLVTLVVGLRGRRRRWRTGGGLLVAGALVVAARPSAAQSHRNIDLNVFDPIPATVSPMFHVQSANVGANGTWAASALVTYANNALVLDTSQNDDIAVKNRALLVLGGAYVFGGRFEAGATLPLLMQSGDPAGDPNMRFGVQPASGAALGDAALHAKARFGVAPAFGGSFAYGAGVTLTLPTATSGEFAGNELPTGRAMLLGSVAAGRLGITINAGAIVRDKTRFANLTQGSGGVWGAGASYRVLNKLWAAGELFGELIPGGKTDMMGKQTLLNTIEGLAGVHYRPLHTMSLGVALGRGVTSGPGAPAIRGLVTFSYTPGADELKPLRPRRPAGPPRDDDGDGVPNSLDECPDAMEDKDMFKDEDGCPDPDNDNDGIPDEQDKCPRDPEDRDRFEDDDGCPDLDNDNDGIPDAKDKCPMAAEDKDGFQDGDGCPEPDNDKDGLLDSVDKCPNEAEVINGVDDDDGCPDKGNSLVVISPDRLELLEAVQFSGTKIAKSSANILGQIGATLRANPEILRVRLTVHVQPTRAPKADLKLSEARAKAVRDWLVDWGVDPLRLQSSGFGGKQPLVPPNTKGAQMINDRLELIVLERK